MLSSKDQNFFNIIDMKLCDNDENVLRTFDEHDNYKRKQFACVVKLLSVGRRSNYLSQQGIGRYARIPLEADHLYELI